MSVTMDEIVEWRKNIEVEMNKEDMEEEKERVVTTTAWR